MLSSSFFKNADDIRRLFDVVGLKECLYGAPVHADGKVTFDSADYRLETVYEQDENGVFARRDLLENTTDHPITFTTALSRFCFEGGEYEVYTQYNAWQNESTGAWQPLVTSVTAVGRYNRMAQNAAPFLVLWSAQENRGVAFHLIADCSWKMSATRESKYAKYARTVVEMGMLEDGAVTLAPGEKLVFPEIICYEITNKTDMDAYKLHAYMHKRYPRRTVPVIYNSWMYRFDHFTFDDIFSQIALAADLGVEYFVIDAGWFGKGASWTKSVGDWSENMTGAFAGRMIEVADEVRRKGMKFGLWLEPERADAASDSVQAHPEYYVHAHDWYPCCAFDFTNPEAREWMLGVIGGLIEHYGVAYIKNDDNVDMLWDPKHASYREYHEGHNAFIEELRRRYPDLYITNCAGGGGRLELSTYRYYDSSWPSDNESPYVEMRMYKESILRMPPQNFEKWTAIHSQKGFEKFYASFGQSPVGQKEERVVACGDAVWKHVEAVPLSYLKGYMTGGPIGFSCDLSLVSEHVFSELRDKVAAFKKEREFWRTAVARILCDTPTVTVYQYSDMALSKVVVQLFTGKTLQDVFRVYPVLDPDASYRMQDGTILMGKEIMEEGIRLQIGKPGEDVWNEMVEVILEKVE